MRKTLGIFGVALIISGCGKDHRGSEIFSTIGVQSVPTINTDAMLFQKNPVFKAQSIVGVDPTTLDPREENLDALLEKKVVTIPASGAIGNSDISIANNDFGGSSVLGSTSTILNPVVATDAPFKFSSSGDSNKKLAQLSAYYWANLLISQADSLDATKKTWVRNPLGKAMKIYPHCYDGNGTFSQSKQIGLNAFWVKDQNSLCMGYQNGFETSFDASVLTHELGHGELEFATGGKMTAEYCGSTDTVNFCGFPSPSKAGIQICTTTDGCGGALDEGIADVHAYFMFPDGALFEFLEHDLKGAKYRNGQENHDQDNGTLQGSTVSGTTLISRMVAAEGDLGAKEIHNLGAVYASGWFSLMKTIDKNTAAKLFFAHLSLITGKDTFIDGVNKAIRTDKELNGGSNCQKIKDSFTKHGVNTSTTSACQ